MGHKGISRSKQTHKIVPNEPSNIFEISMMQRGNKPVRVVDFNELIVNSPIKQIDGIKRLKKSSKRNFIDFDGLFTKKKEEIKFDIFKSKVVGKAKDKDPGKQKVTIGKSTKVKFENIKEVQKTIEKDKSIEDKSEPNKDTLPIPNTTTKVVKTNPIVHRTFSARVLASLNEHSTITDLIKNYVIEKQKRSKSPYLEDLRDKLVNGNVQIEDINLEKEVVHLEGEIEEISKQDTLWKEIKANVFKKNTTYDLVLEDLNERFKKSVNINKEDFKKQFEREKEKIDKKLTEHLAKINFLRESVSLNIKNIKSKVEEDEKKIFNLTDNGTEFDTMVLLKAITRSR